MRITKQIAENVASKLLLKKNEYLNLSKDDLEKLVCEIMKSKVPESVLKVFKSNPEYVETSNYISLNGNGFNWERVCLGKQIPCKNTDYTPTYEESRIISEKINTFQKLKKEISDLKHELVVNIFNLKTYKQVEENFPEAYVFLPEIKNNAVAVNLTTLRAKLK